MDMNMKREREKMFARIEKEVLPEAERRMAAIVPFDVSGLPFGAKAKAKEQEVEATEETSEETEAEVEEETPKRKYSVRTQRQKAVKKAKENKEEVETEGSKEG